MNILVTAGNTLVPIDRVRCITNLFTGRTGAQIAYEAVKRGHQVELLTSHPETVAASRALVESWTVTAYETFDDLNALLEKRLPQGTWNAFIHCAAVSDFRTTGIYAPASGTYFEDGSGRWFSSGGSPPGLVDRSAAKVKSDEPVLWLRLGRTPKLIDLVRKDWDFHGILVKFKLEVGVSEANLLAIAERSRLQSRADLMVANTLEGRLEWALLGPLGGEYQRIGRAELACRLLEAVEQLHKEQSHG